MTARDAMQHGRQRVLAALPLTAVAVVALLSVMVRSEAGPGLPATTTPIPDAALEQTCIDGAAVGTGNDGLASDCALLVTMDADKTVTATFTELPATRCATPAATDCIRAVYRGAPDDYAQVADIPTDVRLAPASDGRYYVERGVQYTVVTAAQLPEGWTRFSLQRDPGPRFGVPSPVSFSQLIRPVDTTYTFTVSEDDAASTLITFDLTVAKPHAVRPNHKPVLGDVVVTTVFSVEATSFRYNKFDGTGAVATPGSYAFLSDPDDTTSAVATYEALRDGTATALLVHKADAHGASQAAHYDAVEAGDLFEWHEADDCFVRYKVTAVKPDPTGTVPRKLLAVERYAFTYGSCDGPIPTTNKIATIWSPDPIRAPDIPVPVRYGTFILSPAGWFGAVEEPTDTPPNGCLSANATGGVVNAEDHPLWVEPNLPPGLTRYYSETGLDGIEGWAVGYEDTNGYVVLIISAARCHFEPVHIQGIRRPPGADGRGGWINEARLIAGRPAIVWYDPDGRGFDTRVYVYEPSTGVSFVLSGHVPLLANDLGTLIQIAKSLLREAPN